MIQLCNATESGRLKRGCLVIDFGKDDEYYFAYKMVNGGFVSGKIDDSFEDDILDIWNDDRIYIDYTIIVYIHANQKEGTISFIKEGFYLQIPFEVSHLSLDGDDEVDEDEEVLDFDYFNAKEGI